MSSGMSGKRSRKREETRCKKKRTKQAREYFSPKDVQHTFNENILDCNELFDQSVSANLQEPADLDDDYFHALQFTVHPTEDVFSISRLDDCPIDTKTDGHNLSIQGNLQGKLSSDTRSGNNVEVEDDHDIENACGTGTAHDHLAPASIACSSSGRSETPTNQGSFTSDVLAKLNCVLMASTWAKIQCHQVEDDSCMDDTFTNEVSEFVETDGDELLLEGLEEMEKEEASSSDSLSCNNLLYQDAQINYDDSMLLIMAFSVRHKLSGAAIEDLVQLLSLHCPEGANTVKNLREFQTFLQALQNPIVRHYYCPRKGCQVYIGVEEPGCQDTCFLCNEPLSRDNFFLELPIESQLRDLLSGTFSYNL